MGYGYKKDIPEMLILAQELQKSREYKRSKDMYMEFAITHPKHCMRFKAYFEVADNLYYEKKYNEAFECYNNFLKYCFKQDNLTDEEIDWINAYKSLAKSRLRWIKENGYKTNQS